MLGPQDELSCFRSESITSMLSEADSAAPSSWTSNGPYSLENGDGPTLECQTSMEAHEANDPIVGQDSSMDDDRQVTNSPLCLGSPHWENGICSRTPSHAFAQKWIPYWLL